MATMKHVIDRAKAARGRKRKPSLDDLLYGGTGWKKVRDPSYQTGNGLLVNQDLGATIETSFRMDAPRPVILRWENGSADFKSVPAAIQAAPSIVRQGRR